MTSPDGAPDPTGPLPALPVCATCSHLYVTHRRGRCRATTDTHARCGWIRFAEPAPAGPARPDLDVTEDQPA
ncbi:hypothetical protein CC117_02705 [Parafrankia colletiae]|uniref:Uncharacterized protein n=1 Tax=Parafrankia colletiae TaxID=573497 RepID=A0A1S1QXH2_9ACTN|nr:hypothetical protein [Parafrankia colletiae]MCK9899105.1 hypothetical protein [Frankia sp. Cpl3]OHV38670.1 hypothetical protein CC117_02705 [Parafrankia colletiae]